MLGQKDQVGGRTHLDRCSAPTGGRQCDIERQRLVRTPRSPLVVGAPHRVGDGVQRRGRTHRRIGTEEQARTRTVQRTVRIRNRATITPQFVGHVPIGHGVLGLDRGRHPGPRETSHICRQQLLCVLDAATPTDRLERIEGERVRAVTDGMDRRTDTPAASPCHHRVQILGSLEQQSRRRAARIGVVAARCSGVERTVEHHFQRAERDVLGEYVAGGGAEDELVFEPFRPHRTVDVDRRGGDLRSPAPHRSIVGVLEIGHRCDAASGQFCRRRQRGPVGLVGVGQLVECVQPLHAVVVTQDPGRVIDAELGKKGRTEPQCVQVHARHGSSTSRQCVLQQILVRRIRPQGVSETLRTENPMPVPLVRSRENVDQIDCGIRPGDIDT